MEKHKTCVKLYIQAIILCTILVLWAPAHGQGDPSSLLKRIKIATIGAPNVITIADWYSEWLDYEVSEQGTVDKALADSWGTAKSAGRPYIIMRSKGTEDVFIRAVEIDPVPQYRPLTTWGWNAIEITVEDVDRAYERVLNGPFEIIGTPETLGENSPLKAMQMIGPAGEVIYLTSNSGDRAKWNHPEPRSAIDRPFIMVVAGPNLSHLVNFYANKFSMKMKPLLNWPVDIIASAQSLPPDHIFQLAVLDLSERGNKIELDGYPRQHTGPRPHNPGQLPPGVAMVSFDVNNLDYIDVNFISPPGILYGSSRAATFIGPTGELTELIENTQ